MAEKLFRLPWDTLSVIEKIILAYLTIDGYATTQDVIAAGGPGNAPIISRTNSFLIWLKILKVAPDKKRKRLTPLGLKLAQALAEGNERDAGHFWHDLVVDNEQIRRLVLQIRGNKGALEHHQLVEFIPKAIGEKRSRQKDTADGARTIIQILGKAGLIEHDYRNGTYTVKVDFEKKVVDTDDSQSPELNAFVNPKRIDQLRGVSSAEFDLSRLIRLCEEINTCHASECFFAVAMLCRSIMDHVPPIFRCKEFSEVYGTHGPRSFKEAMQHLDKSFRKIADSYLHGHIRRKEVLPNRTQVDFRGAIDLLLSEVVRVLD